MHRNKDICTDIALIHADMGGYLPEINRYLHISNQIIRDMHIYYLIR